jgi:hypothetical protein
VILTAGKSARKFGSRSGLTLEEPEGTPGQTVGGTRKRALNYRQLHSCERRSPCCEMAYASDAVPLLHVAELHVAATKADKDDSPKAVRPVNPIANR